MGISAQSGAFYQGGVRYIHTSGIRVISALAWGCGPARVISDHSDIHEIRLGTRPP